MLNNKTFLGIIPARGKSKRLPRKNLLDLCGKPLIAWSIEAGQQSAYIDKIIVTSDDDEILGISRDLKVESIKRPSKFASDISTTFDAIKHTIDNFEKFDYIVLLQPTSPLRNSRHIDQAIELLESKNADAIVSVCEMNYSPLWSNVLPNNLSLEDFINDGSKGKRSQDLEVYYRINGAIYICKTEKLLEEKTFMLKCNIFAYIMTNEYSIDIDTLIDFKLAKLYLEELIIKKD